MEHVATFDEEESCIDHLLPIETWEKIKNHIAANRATIINSAENVGESSSDDDFEQSSLDESSENELNVEVEKKEVPDKDDHTSQTLITSELLLMWKLTLREKRTALQDAALKEILTVEAKRKQRKNVEQEEEEPDEDEEEEPPYERAQKEIISLVEDINNTCEECIKQQHFERISKKR